MPQAEYPMQSLNQKVISLERASVRYRLPNMHVSTFKEYIIRTLQGKLRHHDFWALHDVNIEVSRGDVYGVIGRNGAGKSTLMKLIAKVLRPSEGRVWVRGRVAPLLEVGAGFHPELTGRENIFLNGAVLGFTRKQMDNKYQRIVDFADLSEFIDVPMRAYSSGMWARLGFAVATDECPDILLVDEVLAVGDEAFQKKCLERLHRYQAMGTTILLISHSMALIEEMCTRVAWIEQGVVQYIDTPREVIDEYRRRQS
jgi:ABC-2 type transport system ATP-binding protein